MYNGKLASFALSKPIRGLPEGAVCRRYLAGLADGVIGDGTHNYIGCDLGNADDATASLLNAKRATVINQITACLGPSGWTGGKVENKSSGRLSIERATFKPATGAADIVIETEGRTMRSRSDDADNSYMMVMQIRIPSLLPPELKPAQ